jgi:hypothetical protein
LAGGRICIANEYLLYQACVKYLCIIFTFNLQNDPMKWIQFLPQNFQGKRPKLIEVWVTCWGSHSWR